MRKNDAGLTILEKGDVVRIGQGQTRYTVLGNVSDSITVVVSHNTGKSSSQRRERLYLVQSVQDVAYEAGCDVEEIQENVGRETGDFGPVPEPVDTDDADEEEAPVKETSAYQKAVLFALNKLQKHVYAGTVRKNVKAKRRGLSARQKASRKANR